MIEISGARLPWLPPYSAVFCRILPNSIPSRWHGARLKALVRKAVARAKEELNGAIANAVEKHTADQRANYFKACGYQTE